MEKYINADVIKASPTKSRHHIIDLYAGTILVLSFRTYRPNDISDWCDCDQLKPLTLDVFISFYFFSSKPVGEARIEAPRIETPYADGMRCWKQWCVYRSITVTLSDHKRRLIGLLQTSHSRACWRAVTTFARTLHRPWWELHRNDRTVRYDTIR